MGREQGGDNRYVPGKVVMGVRVKGSAEKKDYGGFLR